jgi:citrate lyase alpha subunit
LTERDTTLDVVAKHFNATPDRETLVVEHQGRTLTLAQRVSKVVSSGSAVQNMAPPPVMTNVPPAVTQSVVVNPTPADEARRLEAVASEVARRRALREQASQQMGQSQPMPAPQPQVQPQPAQPRGPMPATSQQRPQRK